MKSELEDLKITEKELESLSGLDVDEVFVGGVFGGVYRPSIFQNSMRFISFCVAEFFVGMLTFIFTLPIGFIVIRNYSQSVNELPIIAQFFQLTLGITLIILLGWNFYMWRGTKRLTFLLHLLDDIDRYNKVVQGIELLDQLEAIDHLPVNLENREQVLAALQVTRSSLVSGIMTEKILRENRGLLARRQDLLAHIESNLVTLRSIEMSDHASEYGQLLNEALAISISVHAEVQKLSGSPGS
jgi:hypothetical protein